MNKLLSDLQENYYSKKIEENKDNLKGTWKILKQAIGQESKSSTIGKVIHKGCEISGKKEIANIGNEHFVFVGKRLAVNISDTAESPTGHIKPTRGRFVFHKVMTFQVEKAMKKLIKSGDKDDLNNCKPITVLPTIARVFERLLFDQMYTYLVENELLGNQQFGFRSIHSTALALGKSVSE